MLGLQLLKPLELDLLLLRLLLLGQLLLLRLLALKLLLLMTLELLLLHPNPCRGRGICSSSWFMFNHY